MSGNALAEEKWAAFFNTVDPKPEAPNGVFTALKSAVTAETPQSFLGAPFTRSPLERGIVDKNDLLIPRAVNSLKNTFDGIWRDHLRFAVLCALVVFVTTAVLQPPLVRDIKGKRDWRMIFIYTLFSFLLTIFLPMILNMSGSIASYLVNFFG